METLLQKIKRVGLKGCWDRLSFKVSIKKAHFFMYLSRKILKHEGGLDYHITGHTKNFFIQKLSNPVIAERNSNLVADLKVNQYAKVNLNIPQDLLQTIKSKIDVCVTDEKTSIPRGSKNLADGKYYSRALTGLLNNIPEIKQLITPQLDGILKEYFGANYAVTSVLCWRNYSIPETNESKYLYSNEWHNDYMEPKELKLFINMTDVTVDDGPLHVVSNPVTASWVNKGIYRGRRAPANDIQAMETSPDLVRHVGPAGSAVFCHTSTCLHRADVPKQGHYRDMLEFQFRPSIKALPQDWENTKMKYT